MRSRTGLTIAALAAFLLGCSGTKPKSEKPLQLKEPIPYEKVELPEIHRFEIEKLYPKKEPIKSSESNDSESHDNLYPPDYDNNVFTASPKYDSQF